MAIKGLNNLKLPKKSLTLKQSKIIYAFMSKKDTKDNHYKGS